MFTKTKTLIKYGLLLLLFVLCFSLVRGIAKLTSSNQKVLDEKTKVENLQKENEKLSQEFASIQSPQFIESQARDKLGLAKKGEIVVVLPDDNSLRAIAPKLPQQNYQLPDPNWQLWLKLFD
jgi:cell division protein DivIC